MVFPLWFMVLSFTCAPFPRLLLALPPRQRRGKFSWPLPFAYQLQHPVHHTSFCLIHWAPTTNYILLALSLSAFHRDHSDSLVCLSLPPHCPLVFSPVTVGDATRLCTPSTALPRLAMIHMHFQLWLWFRCNRCTLWPPRHCCDQE